MANWYDHPQYYDMLFRDETVREVDFFEKVFQQFGHGNIRRLLEPGCGSGRLLVAMAARGYEVTGLDLSQPMLDYTSRRLSRRGLEGKLVLGDMTDFRVKGHFDAAFCTFNTFRHLLNESDAVTHLKTVASHLQQMAYTSWGFTSFPWMPTKTVWNVGKQVTAARPSMGR